MILLVTIILIFQPFTHTNTRKSYNWMILWKFHHYDRWYICRYVIPILESSKSFPGLVMRIHMFGLGCLWYYTYPYIWVFTPSLGGTMSSTIVRMTSYHMAYLSILCTILVRLELQLYVHIYNVLWEEKIIF